MAKNKQTQPPQAAEHDPLAALRVMEDDTDTNADGSPDAGDATPADDSNVNVQGDASVPEPVTVRYFCDRTTYLSWGDQFINVPRDTEVHDGNYGPNAVARMKAAGVPFREEKV